MLANKLRSMLAEQLAVFEVQILDTMHLIHELNMDELDASEFAIFLEEVFGEDFIDALDFEQLEKLDTFENLVSWVEHKLSAEATEKFQTSEDLHFVENLNLIDPDIT